MQKAHISCENPHAFTSNFY